MGRPWVSPAPFGTRLGVNDFFVFGESYGGHYVPSISYKIHMENNKIAAAEGHAGQIPIVLGGLAIGDGWIDPINMVQGYPAMMSSFGMLGDVELAKVKVPTTARHSIAQHSNPRQALALALVRT